MPQQDTSTPPPAGSRQPPRFYCPRLPDPRILSEAEPAPVDLPDAEARHARQVLRLKAGDAVRLFSGNGLSGGGTIAAIDKRSARVTVIDIFESARPSPSVDIAVALPKGDRVKALVDQLSQAGVDRLIPLATQHAATALTANKRAKLERAAIEAAKQCGRDFVLTIEPEATPDDLFQEKHATTLLACPDAPHESTHQSPLLETLRGAERVVVLIGPEGGWSQAERQAARAAGVTEWRFGPHVMRIETAAVVAAGIVRWAALDAKGAATPGEA